MQTASWNFHEMGGLQVEGKDTVIEGAFWGAAATMRQAKVGTCVVPGVRMLGDDRSNPADYLPEGLPLEFIFSIYFYNELLLVNTVRSIFDFYK